MRKAGAPRRTARSSPGKVKPGAAARKRSGARADYGAPIDGFIARQPPHLRAILEALRRLVEEAAPDARASIKWGMPVFDVEGRMMCALGGHKAHVNLVLFGPTGTYADPEGRLAGEGKAGRHLTLRRLEELPRQAVRRWLRAAAAVAREQRG